MEKVVGREGGAAELGAEFELGKGRAKFVLQARFSKYGKKKT